MKVGMRKKSCIVRGVAGRVIGHSGRIRAGGPRRRHMVYGLGTARGSRDAAERTAPRIRAEMGVQLRRREDDTL